MSAAGEFSIVEGVPKPVLAKALEAAAFELLELARKEYASHADTLGQYIRAPEGYPNRFPTLERLGQLRAALDVAANAYAETIEQFQTIARQACELRGGDDTPGSEELRA